MVSFSELSDALLERLRGSESLSGINVAWGSQALQAPSIHVVIYPSGVKRSNRGVPMIGVANADIYCTAIGSPNEQEGLNNAMEIAIKCLHDITTEPWYDDSDGIRVVEVVNSQGQLVYSDRTTVVLECRCLYDILTEIERD